VSPLGVAAAATAAPRRRPPFGHASLSPRLSFHKRGARDLWAEGPRIALLSSDCGGGSDSAACEGCFAEEQEKAAKSILPAIREGVGQGRWCW
jgi:hypothetical protein